LLVSLQPLHRITVLISVAMLDMQAADQLDRGFGQLAEPVKMLEIVLQLMVHPAGTVPVQVVAAVLAI
jgi:hypothetical protein